MGFEGCTREWGVPNFGPQLGLSTPREDLIPSWCGAGGWGCPHPQSWGRARGTRTWLGGEGFVLTCFGFCWGLPDSSLGLWGHRKERGEGFPQLWGVWGRAEPCTASPGGREPPAGAGSCTGESWKVGGEGASPETPPKCCCFLGASSHFGHANTSSATKNKYLSLFLPQTFLFFKRTQQPGGGGGAERVCQRFGSHVSAPLVLFCDIKTFPSLPHQNGLKWPFLVVLSQKAPHFSKAAAPILTRSSSSLPTRQHRTGSASAKADSNEVNLAKSALINSFPLQANEHPHTHPQNNNNNETKPEYHPAIKWEKKEPEQAKHTGGAHRTPRTSSCPAPLTFRPPRPLAGSLSAAAWPRPAPHQQPLPARGRLHGLSTAGSAPRRFRQPHAAVEEERAEDAINFFFLLQLGNRISGAAGQPRTGRQSAAAVAVIPENGEPMGVGRKGDPGGLLGCTFPPSAGCGGPAGQAP